MHEILTFEYFQPLSQKHEKFANPEALRNKVKELCSMGHPNITSLAFGPDWQRMFSPSLCTDSAIAPIIKDYRERFQNWTGSDLFKTDLSMGIPSSFNPKELEIQKNILRDANLRLVIRESLESYNHVMAIGGNFSADKDGKEGCGHLSQNYRIFERNASLK